MALFFFIETNKTNQENVFSVWLCALATIKRYGVGATEKEYQEN